MLKGQNANLTYLLPVIFAAASIDHSCRIPWFKLFPVLTSTNCLKYVLLHTRLPFLNITNHLSLG